MRKIVDGLLYDTEKAVKLAFLRDNCLCKDYTLYRTRNGRYFLAWVNDEAPNPRAREGVVAMTEEKAKIWVAAYFPVETYTEIFGEPEEA